MENTPSQAKATDNEAVQGEVAVNVSSHDKAAGNQDEVAVLGVSKPLQGDLVANPEHLVYSEDDDASTSGDGAASVTPPQPKVSKETDLDFDPRDEVCGIG